MLSPKYIIALSLFLTIVAACAKQDDMPDGRRISANQAKRMADRNAGAVLLDVRTEAEFSDKRIAGATLLPIDSIRTKASRVLPDKDALILVYCRRGIRSMAAAEQLVSMGYTNVYDFGGIESNRVFRVERD